MTKTNPNGANQYVMDPRQKMCWDFYINPKSKTFGNALQSALKAKYSQGAARQITVETWFVEKCRKLNMLKKAERNLDEFLDLDIEELVVTVDGVLKDKDGNIVKKTNKTVLKVKQDTSKFIAERLGKNEGFSAKTEFDIPDGLIKVELNINESIKKIYGEPISGENAEDSEGSEVSD